VLLHWDTRYVILVDIIQTLTCYDNWSSIFVRQEDSAPTANVNAGRLWIVRTPANEDIINAGVEREPWRSTLDIAREVGLSQSKILEVLHDDQVHP
jgi:hypothetical protein